MVAGIGNQQIARSVEDNVSRSIQSGADCRAAVAAETRVAVARYCSDDARSVYLPDAMVAGIDNIDIARAVYSCGLRSVESGDRRQSAVSDKRDAAGNRRYLSQSQILKRLRSYCELFLNYSAPGLH